MATYTHYGKQADVFKHLVLCEVLQIEKPQIYIETNSASAIYQMAHTPEQQYGIYYFLKKAREEKPLRESPYYKLESTEMAKGNYLGSPALAMNTLAERTSQYLFFDIEKDALENIESYAKQVKLESHIQTCHTDSLEGIIKLLPSLSQASFLHIDPYEIDKKGISGTTYLDVLIQATQAGMKCLLWYGFMTGNNKIHINQYIVNRLEEENIKEYTCIELIMNSIRKDTIPCNPGILGSGILATNLSKEANKAIWDYSDMLVCMYSDTKYKSYAGRLYRDSIK